MLSNWMMNRAESSATPIKYTHVNKVISVGVGAVTAVVAISLFVFVLPVIKVYNSLSVHIWQAVLLSMSVC